MRGQLYGIVALPGLAIEVRAIGTLRYDGIILAQIVRIVNQDKIGDDWRIELNSGFFKALEGLLNLSHDIRLASVEGTRT